MSRTLLTGESVEALTGFKRKREQCEWLKKRGFQFHINGRGKVVVLLGERETRRTPELGPVK